MLDRTARSASLPRENALNPLITYQCENYLRASVERAIGSAHSACAVTKPITHRPLKRPGGKPSKPPANALQLVREYAADGFSVVGVAAKLGTTPKTFNKWLEATPELQDAFDAGREAERWALHNKLFRLAMEQDNAPAAMFLLKARHGYREGDQSVQGGGVSVTVALPGAMSLQQFNSIGKDTTDAQG